ncbi:serine hydrolase [Bradyrhizobium canariense]|uniref:D-alanyl-D-alanine carboxypeptidase n=1 Tax=Bradyrhizobium canariense TaxID=255045 RepID=A0A1H1NYS0_9BRAD|nr:serine hydrolase [Bradyrhizobium canariense]SDS04093.1 D-alanyl-D-alanine carboxypeptidase [Bradyrhizobium canariense]
MLRTTLASSRVLRVFALGLVTATAAVIFTSSTADARHYRHHHAARHHEEHESYSPAFSSIIVDANSGATLTSNSADSIRHPASLTKIMTLYLLFERLESGKMTLDTEMPVSERASDQAPTKLGLRPGQTLRVEDAIKGIVTRSANDAAVVVAEAIGGDEEEFCKMMTRKARALGMTRTTYVNANGLPDDDQVTTARDQATLGRAIQDRFPRYYRYFSTLAFNYHGQTIRNHNHLLGSMEGIDGIKTGYTRASGFNLVTNLRRGNRHLVGVVMGGRSGGSRDAIMRSLLAENLDKAATTRTVAAITERSPADANADVAEDEAQSRPTQTVQVQGAVQVASTSSEPAAPPPVRSSAPVQKPSVLAAAAAAVPPAQAKPEPAPLTSGVIQSQSIAAIPGSSEPMKPVKVKTVQIKAGQMKVASAAPSQSATSITSAIPPARTEVPETSGAIVAKAEGNKEDNQVDAARTEMPPQPANFGTGHGVLGVLPASSLPAAPPSQAMAYADPKPQPQAVQQNGAIKPVAAHTGWIIQVGALDSEDEARERIEAARNQAHGLLSKADPFTEPVVSKGDKKLFRARFAGLDRDQAEAVCRTLKRSDISCITFRN